MKKRNLLLATLLVSVAFGLGSTNRAMAESAINIDGSVGNGNDGPWYSGSITPDSSNLNTSNNDGGSRGYEDWAGSETDDWVNLYGSGTLDISRNLGSHHGQLNATGGTLNISGDEGYIVIGGNDTIAGDVALTVGSNATLGINGGSVTLNSGDSISGTIDADSGNFTISGGSHNINASTISNAVNLSVASGANLTTSGSIAIGSGDSISGGLNIASGGSLAVNNNISVGSLTNASTVAVGSNALTVNGALTNSGTIGANKSGGLITQGSSTNTGTISVNTLEVSSGSLTNNAGGLIKANNFTVDAGTSFTNNAGVGASDDYLTTFTNNGSTTNNSSIFSNTVTNNSSLTNSQGATINSTTVNNVGGTLQNLGTITTTTYNNQSNGSGADGNTTNSGTINANTLNNSSMFTNSGSVNSNVIKNTAGTFTNSGTVGSTNATSTINNSAGALFINSNTIYADHVTNNGEYQNSTSGSVLNAVQFDNNANSQFINNGTSTIGVLHNASSITGESGQGSLTVSNGGSSSGTISQSVIELTGGNFANTGTMTSTTFTNGATVTGTGTITVANGGSSTGAITQAAMTLTGGAFVNDANITTTGAFTTGANLDNDANINAGGTFTNTGAITTTSNSGTITTAAGGSNTGTIAQKDMTLNGTTLFDNDGNITISGVLTNAAPLDNDANIIANTFINSGAITTASGTGTITVANGGSSTAAITQAAMTLTGGAFVNDANITTTGAFTNGSALDNDAAISAGTFVNTGVITTTDGTGTITVANGGSSTAAITQAEMTLSGGTFANDAPLTVTDALTVATGSILNNSSNITVSDATNKDAVLTNAGTINTAAGSTILTDTLVNHAVVIPDPQNPEETVVVPGTINMTNATVAVYYQADDIQGVINVKENPDPDPDDDIIPSSISELAIASADASNPAEFIGDLNVGGTGNGNAELDFTSGVIGEAADVAIASGSTLKLDSTISSLVGVEPQTPTLTLNGAQTDDDGNIVVPADNYSGDLVNVNGDVTLKDMEVYTGDDSTTAGGTNPHYEQTGGALNLVNTEMTMENSSNISGGDMTVDEDSVFNSESGAFIVGDLQNDGLVNGMNTDYQDYTVNSDFIAGGAGDTQGDFAIDIYARSNNNNDSDTFGSDTAHIMAANQQEGGILNISDLTLNGDIFGYAAPIDSSIDLGQVFIAQTIDDNVQFTATAEKVFTPIGWYGLTPTGAGNYSFDLKRFNPTVFRGQVTKIAQYQNQLAIDDMLFNHTMLDQGFKGNDYIASNPNRLASANDLYPPYQYSRKDGGLWVKMYGTFEKLNMNHGLHVGNNSYGTILGADFGMKDLRHGWQFMPTAYIAYNGAHQYWNRTGAYQNGAQLGVMGTWYKDNFMIGALAFGGVYNNDMSTPRGSDDTFNYFAGGSVKAAYNWRFAKDWALQPNLLVAYSFFGQENWHTDFGQMGMMSGMLNGVNVAPGLNLIWEKETFSTYATIQYMYNVNQSVGGRAGNVYLPHVHMDRGYIQYGLGINKKFTDRFSGYFQTVLRNVGRTGVGLQLGFNWQFGKGGNNSNMRGYTPELKKTAIKLNGNRY